MRFIIKSNDNRSQIQSSFSDFRSKKWQGTLLLRSRIQVLERLLKPQVLNLRLAKNSSFCFSSKNNLHAVVQQSTSAKFWSFYFCVLLNRFLPFLLISVNENLLLLTFLSHFFHFVLCIWKFYVLKVNSILHAGFLHIQFTATTNVVYVYFKLS